MACGSGVWMLCISSGSTAMWCELRVAVHYVLQLPVRNSYIRPGNSFVCQVAVFLQLYSCITQWSHRHIA